MLQTLKKALRWTLEAMALFDYAARIVINRRAAQNGITVAWGRESAEVTKGMQRLVLARKDTLYVLDMVNDFQRYFEACMPDSYSCGLEVVDYSQPRLHRTMPDGIELWYTALAENLALMEREYCFRYMPKAGDVVLDCGGYCGDTAYLFSRKVGETGIVVVFEPDDENFAMLERNIALHKLDNVIPIKKGVWSKSTMLEFSVEGNLGSGIAKLIGRRGPCTRNVDVVSLDDVVSELGLTRIDLIKMDIEGAEIEAVRGAQRLFSAHCPHVVIANHLIEGKDSHYTVTKDLQRCGYATETLSVTGRPGWADLFTYGSKVARTDQG